MSHNEVHYCIYCSHKSRFFSNLLFEQTCPQALWRFGAWTHDRPCHTKQPWHCILHLYFLNLLFPIDCLPTRSNFKNKKWVKKSCSKIICCYGQCIHIFWTCLLCTFCTICRLYAFCTVCVLASVVVGHKNYWVQSLILRQRAKRTLKQVQRVQRLSAQGNKSWVWRAQRLDVKGAKGSGYKV